jgi:hypothetical protein
MHHHYRYLFNEEDSDVLQPKEYLYETRMYDESSDMETLSRDLPLFIPVDPLSH